MSEKKFKSGDVVQLKSGSPFMTVDEYGTYSGRELVKCIWFDNSKKCGDVFKEDSLEIVDMEL